MWLFRQSVCCRYNNKLKEKRLDEGTISRFDFNKVKEIQFAYWDDVTVYLDKFAFVKPASVEKTGFTTEQEDIPDYGSIESEKLEIGRAHV